MKIAVIYCSKYGTTKKYAAWIAEELEADLFESKEIKPSQMVCYDVVVYGGGLYGGGIAGVKVVSKNQPKRLVVFTVGLSNPEATDYSAILDRNFGSDRSSMKTFHLRGGIDYKKLGLVHKGMMAMLKKLMLDKKSIDERTEEDQMILETYGDQVDFTEKSAIQPIVDYVRSL